MLRRVQRTSAWDAAHPLSPFDAKRDLSRWLAALAPADWNTGAVEPAVDLDGDGVSDCVLYFHKGAAFVALSGRDGGMIWNHVLELDWRDAFGRTPTLSELHRRWMLIMTADWTWWRRSRSTVDLLNTSCGRGVRADRRPNRTESGAVPETDPMAAAVKRPLAVDLDGDGGERSLPGRRSAAAECG